MMTRFLLLLALSSSTTAFVVQQPNLRPETSCFATKVNTSFMWNRGLNFGKGDFKYYTTFKEWMDPFPQEDKDAYPEIFNVPKGVYEIRLDKPLGIVFEEIEIGKGVYVQDIIPGGNAAIEGTAKPGDILVGITAVKVVGAKFERRMIPARKFDFDTMVGAVSSNEPRYGCEDVILMLERPEEADPKVTDDFMDFFEPPFDNPWKQQQ